MNDDRFVQSFEVRGPVEPSPITAILMPPKVIARWTLDGNVTFAVSRYPNVWHRFWQRLILGIKWERVP